MTAEEFRENSQRSIALFNTEKLSTDSTHVLKSAYCNSVHFCRCNLHGACGGKGYSIFEMFKWKICCNLHGACGGKEPFLPFDHVAPPRCNLHGACGGKDQFLPVLAQRGSCNLHGACGGKGLWSSDNAGHRALQSARGVWRQRRRLGFQRPPFVVAICTGRVEAKQPPLSFPWAPACCNLHGACGGKG